MLPLGGSKGEGVRRLLSSLGVAASDVLAIGDAENDLEVSTRRQSGGRGRDLWYHAQQTSRDSLVVAAVSALAPSICD